jgi:hypothetical protein
MFFFIAKIYISCIIVFYWVKKWINQIINVNPNIHDKADLSFVISQLNDKADKIDLREDTELLEIGKNSDMIKIGNNNHFRKLK